MQRWCRRVSLALGAVLLTGVAASAQAQAYTSVVVFGDSLSDTGNDADLTQAKYFVRVPGPVADYTDGRFTVGVDTLPPSVGYRGVWVEQLAAMLPKQPAVKASLDGGTDYAYGFAETRRGTRQFTFGPNDALSVTVNNVGKQITTYLATHPKIDNKTLFVVWGGAIDVLYATSEEQVIEAALEDAFDVQRLIDAGAKRIIVPNLPPLGEVPRLNGSPATEAAGDAATVLYNRTLGLGLELLPLFNFGRSFQVYPLDTYALFESVLAEPAAYGFADVRDSSQGKPVNPDTYLFWDDLHPTTHGHDLIALDALKLLDPAGCQARVDRGESPKCSLLPGPAGAEAGATPRKSAPAAPMTAQ